jgi:hypothetical protein
VTRVRRSRFGLIPDTSEPLVPRRYTLFTALLLGAVACSADLIEPSAEAIVGRWRRAPMPLSPRGEFLKTLELTADGHYTATTESRGVYAQLAPDAVGSITQDYGAFQLTGNVLRFTQDSVRTWDFLGGTNFHAGPPGIFFEGPPTDPIVELTPNRLTLRYSVNPGGGYVQVTETFDRER